MTFRVNTITTSHKHGDIAYEKQWTFLSLAEVAFDSAVPTVEAGVQFTCDIQG